MTDPEPVRVMVEMHSTANTITGRLAVQGAPAKGFYGWLELIDLLERAAPEHEGATGSEPEHNGRAT